MKRNRRWITTALASVMALTLILAGCSNSSTGTTNNKPSNTTTNQPTESSEETYELTMAIPTFVELKDMEMVEAELSKLIEEKINVKLNIVDIPWSNWQQQTNLMVSSGEALDIMPVIGSAAPLVASGKIIPLDDLISQHGQGIVSSLSEEYLNAGKIDGALYMIPTIRMDSAGIYQFIMRKDIVDKHNIDVSSIKTFEDVENVFKIIKEKEPELTPVVPNASSGMLAYYNQFDDLGDANGVLMDMTKLEVSNLYESDLYKDLLTMYHRWYKEGYLPKDAATNQITAEQLIKSGKGFGYFLSGAIPEVDAATAEIVTGKKMVSALLHDAVATTESVTRVSWTIAQNSKNPEKAMETLNLLYSDKEVLTLLNYGIEGTHYVKVSDNVIDFAPGLDAVTSGYYPGWIWMTGNTFLNYVFKGNAEDQYERGAEVSRTAFKSKAMGFTFQPESVKNEITAITNVKNQYRIALETGTLDPEKTLPEFINKLKAAGIDKVIAEKQKQLDEWAEKNNVE